jgi:hypothetical protein
MTLAHLMPREGAWGEDGTAWFADEHYPTARKAREAYASVCGVRYGEVEAEQVYVRHAPEHPSASEFDGEYWAQCDPGEPGAFLGWRVE